MRVEIAELNDKINSAPAEIINIDEVRRDIKEQQRQILNYKDLITQKEELNK